jgi:hypothetical protein
LKSGQFYDQEVFETKHTGCARLVDCQTSNQRYNEKELPMKH